MEVAERELILRARQGDAHAFAGLVRRYDRRILALALDMVGDVDDAQDVFQEALVAAYRGLSRFRMESDFSTWLYRIAVNKALKFRHRRQRTARREDGATVDDVDPDGGPEEEILAAEMRAHVDDDNEYIRAEARRAVDRWRAAAGAQQL